MHKYRTVRPLAFAAGGAAIGALVLGGPAGADPLNQRAATKFYYSIDSMAMTPTDYQSAGDFHIDRPSGTLYVGGLNRCFNAAIHLPDGATITAVTVYYHSGTYFDPDFHLYRHRYSDGATGQVAALSVPNDTGTRTSANLVLKPTLAVVNNLHFSYGFGVCIGFTDGFYGARITYN